ncbi:hypothetical protein CPB86DRAFT_192280 [Serendipita vermifera]|nr:hypothetical protein CPB86DRAFT_192280 [Serendipita vermifera]
MEIRYKLVLVQDQELLQGVRWLYSYLYCGIDLIFCIGIRRIRVPFPFYQSIILPLFSFLWTLWWLITFVRTHFLSPQYKWVCED